MGEDWSLERECILGDSGASEEEIAFHHSDQ